MLASTKQVRRVYRKLGYDTIESWTNNNHKKGLRTLAFRPAHNKIAARELRQALIIRGFKNEVKASLGGYVRVMDCKYE